MQLYLCQEQAEGGQIETRSTTGLSHPLGSYIVWSCRKVLLPQSFKLLVAVIVTIAFASKDCLWVKVQENREKFREKVEGEFLYSIWVIGNHILFQDKTWGIPGAFSAVLILTFKFQIALHSGLEIPEEKNDKLIISW